MQTNHKFNFYFGLLLAILAIGAGGALANQPSYPLTPTVVDGSISEWDLTNDFFAKMYEAGKPDMTHFSNLYLRYNCLTNTMYALVLRENDWLPDLDPTNAWIKIYALGSSPQVDGNSGNDGTPPDFSWVYDGPTLVGYEASFSLAEGVYPEIEIHTNMNGGRTSSTGKKDKISLEIQCIQMSGLDFGDAPDPAYCTLMASGGAYHVVVPGAPFLGINDPTDAPDAEPNGQPHPAALGDDTNTDDEDGVLIPLLVAGQTAVITFEVHNGPAYVDGWIDFNGNGVWGDVGEYIVSGTFATGVHTPTITVPANAVIGQTFSRFRINSVQPQTPCGGPAEDGEVEDHLVTIEAPPEPGVIIIIKETIPDGEIQTFEFSTSYGPNVSLADGGSDNSGPLTPGIYSVSEINIPPAWNLLSATCDDGSDPGAINLEAGETVTVTFTNTKDVDYGDAPDSYGTLGHPNPANQGASHDIIPLLHLGPSVDTEPDGQPSVPADGDGADENGVTLPAAFVAGTTATITIITGPIPGLLDAWIDFNGNGVFDHATEHLWGGVSQMLPPGVPVPFTISVPASAVPGVTYARFRFSLSGGLLPTGHAPDGEVEDYVVTIEAQPKASISDFIWVDTNANGIQDGGEPGLNGVTVELWECNGNQAIQTTTTYTNGTDGYYLFDNLVPGDYKIKFILPVGYIFTPQDQSGDDTDSDADPTTGFTPCVTLAAGDNNITVDAGLFQLASISDFVWVDTNANGIQDGGEPGLNGVTVELWECNGNAAIQTTTTYTNGTDGYYLFDNLAPGDYKIKFILPAGYSFTPQDQSGDATDSDADPTTGFTPCVTLAAGDNNITVDAGLVQNETTIEVEKNAEVYWERTYDWDILKTVDPAEWHLFHGESGESQYTVQVTRTVGSDMVKVSGQICVTNTGDVATAGLAYIDSLQYKTPAMTGWATLDTDGGTPAVIQPGGTDCYNYEFTFEAIPDAEYRNVAVAQITNFEGQQGQLYGPRHVIPVTLPQVPNKENYALVNVEDTNGMQWQFTDSGSKIYTKTFVCDEHAGSNGNTATIIETGESSSATVVVYCYELDIQKDAKTFFKRQYEWMIDKTAKTKELDLDPCVKDEVPYVVTVDTTGYMDTDFMVKGTITIHNPAPMAATINSLEDILDGELAELDCQPQFPLIIDPGETFECGYQKELPTNEQLVNKATAEQQLFDYPFDLPPVPAGTATHEGTADVIFDEATETVDECVTVTDTNLDPGLLGNACADETPKVFNYTLTVGPYFSSGSYIIDNTATYKTNDTGTEGSDDWRLVLKVKCIPPVANFKADIVDGVSPLTVQFTDLSENAAGWLWEFSDGTTSTEQHPTHVFRNPPLKYYTVKLTVWDCCEEFDDSMVKEDYIRVTRTAEVKFNASPLVVAPDEDVQFMNHCGGGVNWFEWNFGDGEILKLRHNVMDKVHPTHAYAAEGTYTVSLHAYGQGGDGTFTIKDMIYVDPTFVNMQFMEGSATLPNEPWENAMNHDIITSNANAVTLNNEAWAVFSLVDDASPILFDKVRILSNNGMGTRFSNHLIKEFELWVSMDNVTYEKVMTGNLTRGDMWKVFEFTPKAGKYVKLMVKSAQGDASPYAALGEIQLFGTPPAALALLKDVDGLDVLDWEPVTEFQLENAYPNPFNPSTTIQFALPSDAMVQLEVYNIRGQLVSTILNRDVPAGRYTYHFDASDLNSGVYFYRLTAGKFQQIKRMTFLK